MTNIRGMKSILVLEILVINLNGIKRSRNTVKKNRVTWIISPVKEYLMTINF